MKSKLTVGTCLLCAMLIGLAAPAMSPTSGPVGLTRPHSISPMACTSFCLDNGDHCVFGANQDNTLELGLLFVNKRHVLKTTWDPGTSGNYARWISQYGSVTINFVGYQMAWGGMNEAGLMISTMALEATQGPAPDERPPIVSPFWAQYQLDNHSTVGQVIASDADTRIAAPAVDHYLVCDRTGACATIEFLEGKLVYHIGESLPVSVLTNSTYRDSVSAWEESLSGKNLPQHDSLGRFAAAATRVRAFEPSSSDQAVAYAFDTLAAVSRPDTVWSFVYDPANLRVLFRTKHNPRIRYLDLSRLDFSCDTPVKLLDVHVNASGDISDDLVPYTHAASLAHSTSFFSQYKGVSMSPFIVDTLLRGVESFSCQGDGTSSTADLVPYRPLLPPTATWASLAILHRVGPFWILLVVLSLACLVWRMQSGQPASAGKWLLWVLLTILLGPLGLLAYLFARRKKGRVAKEA